MFNKQAHLDKTRKIENEANDGSILCTSRKI